ncbi:MAG: WD40 repeat domain-containing protein [Rhodovarius sp.]|nr:WD40 repeat domain-containing protein [Rhodovarius sp.]MCX7932031.1 WD40 repeat domain-containing protein [Rhodovarius sp.]MDW8313761.1 WD40 repeat domain-containing protein [Rhodovarius sp.]
MSGTDAPRYLLDLRGRQADFGAWVVGIAFCRETGAPGFGLGDGTLRIGLDGAVLQVHRGAVLSVAADCARGFLTGGDDGKLCTSSDGLTTVLADYGRRWVEHVAAHPEGLRVAASGRMLHLLDGQGVALKSLPHPSTVAGVAIDAKGKRVAASHYGGASIWFAAAREDKPRRLEWKGSHGAILFSPDGTHVITAMQENALHGWRLSDGQHMRMTGYPAKTKSMCFTAKGRWLATSGADGIVLWPFFGGGPMGKAPTEIAGGDGVLCTQVACHPEHEVVAAGFADGLVLVAEIASGKILPVAPPGRGGVSALAWHPQGHLLAFGTEEGFAAVVDFSPR